MDLEPRTDDRMHVRLGPVERWIVRLAAAALVAGGYWLVGEIRQQGKTLQTVVTQQAVTNAQMTTLSTQLADVPALTRQMAEVKVQVDRNTQDISELRRLRGLK